LASQGWGRSPLGGGSPLGEVPSCITPGVHLPGVVREAVDAVEPDRCRRELEVLVAGAIPHEATVGT